MLNYTMPMPYVLNLAILLNILDISYYATQQNWTGHQRNVMWPRDLSGTVFIRLLTRSTIWWWCPNSTKATTFPSLFGSR